MIEITITEFESYLQKSKAKSIRFTRNGDEIEISSTLLNFKVIIDLSLFAAISVGFYLQNQRSIDVLPASIIYGFVIVMTWADFKSINIIRIGLVDKTLQIKSRKIFSEALSRMISKKEKALEFSEISAFSVRSNEGFDFVLRRFFVDMKAMVD